MKYKYVLTGLLLAVSLAGGVFFLKKNNSIAPVPESGVDSGKVKGLPGAPVDFIEYSDFECPACQRAQASIQKIIEARPDKIRITFRHFPLPGHRWSAVAHQAAECAAEKGKFWEFHDRLYANQQIWSHAPNALELFFQYAAEIGLNMDPFAQCLSDPVVAQKVLADKKSGDKLQINSTPTFFINKERLVGPVELELKGDEVIRRILGEPLAAPEPPVVYTVPAPVSETQK